MGTRKRSGRRAAPVAPPAIEAPAALDVAELAVGGERYAVIRLGVERRARGPFDRLSPAERSAVELVVRGLKTAEIATLLGKSPHTISNQLARVFAKLGVASRRELVAAYATHAGT
jgi:DNA-binding CsgD family transcriptional regulator